jgi:hypothetical protein
MGIVSQPLAWKYVEFLLPVHNFDTNLMKKQESDILPSEANVFLRLRWKVQLGMKEFCGINLSLPTKFKPRRNFPREICQSLLY